LRERGGTKWISKLLGNIFKRYTAYKNHSLVFLRPVLFRLIYLYVLSNAENQNVLGILDFQVGSTSAMEPLLIFKETSVLLDTWILHSCYEATDLFFGIKKGFPFTSVCPHFQECLINHNHTLMSNPDYPVSEDVLRYFFTFLKWQHFSLVNINLFLYCEFSWLWRQTVLSCWVSKWAYSFWEDNEMCFAGIVIHRVIRFSVNVLLCILWALSQENVSSVVFTSFHACFAKNNIQRIKLCKMTYWEKKKKGEKIQVKCLLKHNYYFYSFLYSEFDAWLNKFSTSCIALLRWVTSNTTAKATQRLLSRFLHKCRGHWFIFIFSQRNAVRIKT